MYLAGSRLLNVNVLPDTTLGEINGDKRVPFLFTILTVSVPVLEVALISNEPEPFAQVELGHLGTTEGLCVKKLYNL